MRVVEAITTAGVIRLEFDVSEAQEQNRADYRVMDDDQCLANLEVDLNLGDQISIEVAEDFVREAEEGDSLYRYYADPEVLGFMVEKPFLPVFMSNFDDLEVFPR